MVFGKDDLTNVDDGTKAVADRLRQSRNDALDNRYTLGRYYGTEWASNFAEWDELEVIVSMEEGWLSFQSESVGEYLNAMEDPDLRNVVFGERNTFTNGFIEGANEIYQTVWPLI